MNPTVPMTIRRLLFVVVLLGLAAAAGCAPTIKLFSDGTEPLRPFVLEGKGPEQVLLVDVDGLLTDEPQRGMLGSRPGVVQEVAARLALAEDDPDIKAVVLKINSPGGTVTASDILYHEIAGFKERTKKPVVAAMMDVAASGGYYIALPADRILAHPTTITGSVGVVFYLPRVYSLLEKLGVRMDVQKSGPNKDMGSPFRDATDEERALMAGIIDTLARRFQDLVRTHRHLDDAALAQAATARIFTADQALGLGLIDQVGYLEDAFDQARQLAGLPEDAAVVVYRREEYANDNPYNSQAQAAPAKALVELDPGFSLPGSGFCYLWSPGLAR